MLSEDCAGHCTICHLLEVEIDYACARCYGRLSSLLAEIPELYALLTPEADGPVTYLASPTLRDGRYRLGLEHPAGPSKAVAAGPVVSGGSTEAPVPADLTVVDLLAPIRPYARRLQARAALGLDEDQVGELSIATELGTWVRDWAERRGEVWRHMLPQRTVTSMCLWLATRLNWAAGHHEALDEFAADLGRLRSRLRRVNGVVEQDEDKAAPCPSCDELWLVQPAGTDWIDCRSCGHHMSLDEYGRWARQLAAA